MMTVKEIVDKLTDNVDLKTVLAYDFGSYGKASVLCL